MSIGSVVWAVLAPGIGVMLVALASVPRLKSGGGRPSRLASARRGNLSSGAFLRLLALLLGCLIGYLSQFDFDAVSSSGALYLVYLAAASMPIAVIRTRTDSRTVGIVLLVSLASAGSYLLCAPLIRNGAIGIMETLATGSSILIASTAFGASSLGDMEEFLALEAAFFAAVVSIALLMASSATMAIFAASTASTAGGAFLIRLMFSRAKFPAEGSIAVGAISAGQLAIGYLYTDQMAAPAFVALAAAPLFLAIARTVFRNRSRATLASRMVFALSLALGIGLALWAELSGEPTRLPAEMSLPEAGGDQEKAVDKEAWDSQYGYE